VGVSARSSSAGIIICSAGIISIMYTISEEENQL